MLMRVSRIENAQVEEVCWADLESRGLTRVAARRYATEASRASFVQRVNGHLPEIVSARLKDSAAIDAVATSLVAKGESGQSHCEWLETGEVEFGNDMWSTSHADLAGFRAHDVIQRFADERKCIQQAVWTALDEDEQDIVLWSGGDWTINWDGRERMTCERQTSGQPRGEHTPGLSTSSGAEITADLQPSVPGRRRLHVLITIVVMAGPDLVPEARAFLEVAKTVTMREKFERIVLPRAERRFGCDVLKWHRPAWTWDVDYSSLPEDSLCLKVSKELRGLPEPAEQDGEWVFSQLRAVFE